MAYQHPIKYIVRGILAALFFWPCVFSWGAQDAGLVRVVMDDNYPPYIFRDPSGELNGILVDQWALWEKKTGVRVRLEAMDWSKAKARMEAGAYDVIDTIFINEQRKALYDFSRPYARLDVPLFFSKELSGIKSAADLKGFVVGVKKDDNSAEILKASGVSEILYFDNYEQVVAAARDGKIKVFTVDEPPALYFLIKMGIQDKFRQSEKPLYTGEFHRAVHKGNAQLLARVERGFAMISKHEYAQIERRWFGKPVITRANVMTVLMVLAVSSLIVGLLLLWIWMLKRTVARRTIELEKDIIERKRVEESLRESEDRFKAIFNATFQFTGLLMLDGTAIELNQTAMDFTGEKAEDFIGRPFWEGPWWRGNEARVRQLKEAVARAAAGEFVRYEVELQGAGDTTGIFDFSIKPICDPLGQVMFLVTEGRDITDRKRAEESIRYSENRYRGLVDLAVDGILLGSHEGVIIEANKCLCEILDMPREDLVGRHIEQMPFTEESLHETPLRFDLLKQGKTVVSERTFVRGDGRNILIEMRTKMMPDGLYQSIIRDITDRKKVEAELERHRLNLEVLINERTAELAKVNKTLSFEKESLQRVNADLNEQRQAVVRMMADLEDANRNIQRAQEQLLHVEKMASLGRLAAGIAHEINNPMSYITTNLAMLERYVLTIEQALDLYRELEEKARALMAEEMRQSLGILQDFRKETEMPELLADLKNLISETQGGVTRVTKIVADLRTFARQEKEAMESADLNYGLDCALTIIGSELRYKVSVVKEYGVLPKVFCYPRQMEQVFINLLMNAVHSIKDNGRIILRTYHLADDVFIEIEDNGCGISERDLPRIFEPFFTTKDVGQGTGLGLSIVYNVIQAHRGEITVRSIVGQGSVFIIRLPVDCVRNVIESNGT